MNIVVTGASKGIGFEIVSVFAKDPGNQVFAFSRDEDRLRALTASAGSQGHGNIHPHKIDISNIDHEQVKAIIAPYSKIDILVNNAGLLINKPFIDLSPSDWRDMFDVNLFGAVTLTKLLLPYLEKSDRAHIVNIGSMGGVQGTSKFPGLSGYSAAKAALANLTECLAEELKDKGIHVNCLALGSVNTEMLQAAFPDYNAPVNADEMARYITWFCEHGRSLFNGKIIPVSVNTP